MNLISSYLPYHSYLTSHFQSGLRFFRFWLFLLSLLCNAQNPVWAQAKLERDPFADQGCYGKDFSLRIELIHQPKHDGSFGQTQFELVSSSSNHKTNQKPKSPSMLFTKEGDWLCLGYNQEARKFILLGKFEQGVVIYGQSIAYLEEKTGKWTFSTYSSSHQAEAQMFINNAVPSQDGRFITLLGLSPSALALTEKQDQMYVVDTKTDTFQKLAGPVPTLAPCSMFSSDDSFDDACYGYRALDDGIITYVENKILQVSTSSYDNLSRRDARRHIQVYDLEKLFIKKAPLKK